tara:strand:- start:748 stop:1617 length:870 start_codon:yes stop_codon:yes gene_type:complete
MSISVVIIAFKSDHILPNLISKIPNHHEIIVIENSLQNKTKTSLENKYNNLKVLIPNENLGYSGGVNLGVEKSKNNFVLIVTADVDFTKEMIENFEECIENFNDFALLAPVYKNVSIHKNFKIFNNKKINEINIKKFQLSEVDEIDGALFLINKKQFDSNKIMDDKFFLYYDSTDLCHNLKKKDKKLFIVKNLKFTHKGTSSSNKNYEFEISINRNWHYSWSKFYFFKKNYNYLYALKKVLPNLFRSLIMYLYFKLISDKKKAKLNKAIISGIANAILLRKSFYRPNIK